MTMPATTAPEGDVMESVIAKGDLAKLTPDERVRYYNSVCRSLGLNTLTNPFAYITLNGKLTLYATRACTDQLRKINGISLEIVSRTISDDILTVHVKARTPDGRVDEDLGAVAFPSMLKGEARANAELKAVTKAKRRATLSICGLGWLDETEIDDIPAAAKRPPKPAPNVMLQPLPPHDAETGEIEPAEDGVDSELVAAHMERCEAAAAKGWKALKLEWDTTPEAVADILRDAHLGRWKEMAKAAEVPA
jgi:hypothetical protein